MKDIFPSLINFEVVFEYGFPFMDHLSQSAFQDLLASATEVNSSMILQPLTVLTRCPNAKSASFYCSMGLGLPSSSHLENSRLTHLEIECDSNFSYLDFKILFWSFPALINLTVNLSVDLWNFDESDFVCFIKNIKPAVAKLKNLTIYGGRKGMTGKSVCALLQNSNLEEFYNFSEIEFSETDLQVFEDIARNRGMKIIPFYRHEKEHYFFSCEHGNHTLQNFYDIDWSQKWRQWSSNSLPLIRHYSVLNFC